MEFYAAERKKELIPFATSMDGTGEHYAKWILFEASFSTFAHFMVGNLRAHLPTGL